MGLTNASVLTKDGRAVLSFDPDNPNRDATVTVDGTTYTQSYDGLFKDSDGNNWSGETAGSGMTASAGSQLRSQMGNILNSNSTTTDKIIDEWGSKVTGANKKEIEGGSIAGDGKSKEATFKSEFPKPLAHDALVRKSYGILRYPSEAFDTDYMTIRQFKYVPLADIWEKTNNTREMRADRRHKHSIGSVTLPIPNQLADSNSVNWNESSLNDMQRGGLRAAQSIMGAEGTLDGLGARLQEQGGRTLAALKNQSAETRQAATSYLLGQLPGINRRPDAVMSRMAGQILNPNLELIFNGVTLRQFGYSFRLTPRNNVETNIVRKIIRFFKQGMAAKETERMFLAAPNIFQPRFYNRDGNQHTFINTIKKCALTNFGVNYAPDNTYMTLPDSSMTAYQITMQFMELDPILDTDYTELDNNTDDVIGF